MFQSWPDRCGRARSSLPSSRSPRAAAWWRGWPPTASSRWPMSASSHSSSPAGWCRCVCTSSPTPITAFRFGDHGVAMRGYLTLNPLRYTHPVLSLLIPIVFIALGGIGVPGGAVYVQTSFMTKRQKTIVSLAGPLTNVAFAVILLVIDRRCSTTRTTGCSGRAWRSPASSRSPRRCSTCCRCRALTATAHWNRT